MMGVGKDILGPLLYTSFFFFLLEIRGNMSVRQLDVLVEGRWLCSFTGGLES
jgi:hypothetical protein